MSYAIFVTGGPGTGKSYTAKKIIERINNITLVCYDDMKEAFWEQYGFNNKQEKEKVNELSLAYFYETLDSKMLIGKNIITEYPLYQRHTSKIKTLIEKYNYDAITILLYGDKQIIYDRQKLRNNQADRHPAHLVDCYHKESFDINSIKDITPPTFEEFYQAIENKDYNIGLGTVFKIDVSDYNKIDLNPIYKKIEEITKGR